MYIYIHIKINHNFCCSAEINTLQIKCRSFPGGSDGKGSACNAGDPV